MMLARDRSGVYRETQFIFTKDLRPKPCHGNKPTTAKSVLLELDDDQVRSVAPRHGIPLPPQPFRVFFRHAAAGYVLNAFANELDALARVRELKETRPDVLAIDYESPAGKTKVL